MPNLHQLEPQSQRTDGTAQAVCLQLASIKGGIFPAAPHMQGSQASGSDGGGKAGGLGEGVRSVITLPWPPRDLSPNARVHHMALAKAKKAYRTGCAWQAAVQGAKKIDAQRLHLTITFVPPNRRAHDLDNCLASIKAGLDGLADVLGVDDKHWSLTLHKADTIGGFVRVEVAHG